MSKYTTTQICDMAEIEFSIHGNIMFDFSNTPLTELTRIVEDIFDEIGYSIPTSHTNYDPEIYTENPVLVVIQSIYDGDAQVSIIELALNVYCALENIPRVPYDGIMGKTVSIGA